MATITIGQSKRPRKSSREKTPTGIMSVKADTPGTRIRSARLAMGISSIAEAARRFKMHPQNWADHEAGRRPVTVEWAHKYAEKLKISFSFILTGQEADLRPLLSVMGNVLADARVTRFSASEILQVAMPAGGRQGDQAYTIKTHDLEPFTEGGMLIVRPGVDPLDLIWKRALVDLDDGRVMFRTISPSQRAGRFTLLGFNANSRPIIDVRIVNAAKFLSYIEPV